MKIAIVGRGRQIQAALEKFAQKEGFKLSRKNPQVVLSCGGEGTALWAELKYPGVPKLFLIYRQKKLSASAQRILKKALTLLKDKRFSLSKLPKLEVIVNGSAKKRLAGLNDVSIHYSPPCALRFRLKVISPRIRRMKDVIGDGVVVSTPYGSGAYFYSITRKTFSKGIGIAFNNPTQRISPMIVPANSRIVVEILRKGGVVAADCDPQLIPVKEGDKILIKKSRERARVIKLLGKQLKIPL